MTYTCLDRDFLTKHPLKSAGIILFLIGRYLFAAFFIYGFWHKFVNGWLWTDLMNAYFTERLGELAAGSFQAIYLEQFAIPLALPIAWIVTIGELIIGICLVLGLAVRANAAFALFLVLNFAAGGYYNLTLPPFMVYSVLMMILPSGQWLGMDRKLHREHPDSVWFR
ncbi:DoxX family protein [Prosthecochloris sp. N3]|uniref:DoxX family protein n=1 Tax=Prosthecochloris ethylica TaxID=2743976 RepID=A0ABR9XSY5_9CHLB|nr:DoxX family membrane protein [Prosthecochloris ethylica]MBF0586962.1 DoxX family protein [Prosthecochloris ethylica]MBF0637161.1 DoxX family protein [Prosthecochloris ethylica]MEC9486680.1 DoxX family membrane protein [Prosthecochloris sp.]NUK48169.1 DoxX family protein [Prosthecochloris ethylica]